MEIMTHSEIALVSGGMDILGITEVASGLKTFGTVTAVSAALYTSFQTGFTVGTWLNNTFDLSTRIINRVEWDGRNMDLYMY
jgi:hypothetical protein